MNDVRYPVGKFQPKESITHEERTTMIQDIADCPQKLRQALHGLTEQQLNTPYREGGWTIKQVVHHLPDSHMNAYIRFKLALTEEEPPIKTYKENMWATLHDANNAPAETSIQLLDALHTRWSMLLKSLAPDDFKRTFRHPENGIRPLDSLVQLYSWHGKHHVAHITSLRDKMGW